MDISFSNDPKLYILLPVIYYAWQDAAISNEEYTRINQFIDNQSWLTKAEKEFLSSKINASSPPSRSELFHWKENIDSALSGNNKPKNFTDLGILLANAERTSLSEEDIIAIAPKIAELEQQLGIGSVEILSEYQKRTSITQSHNTKSSFNVSLMTELLNGEQSEIINKVKSIISREDFTPVVDSNTQVFREKVFAWCKFLADAFL